MKRQEITACVFLHREGKLFIAKRANTKKFLPGKFELIGGRMEFGEKIEDGLIREAMEELHIKIKVGQPFFAFTYLSENDTKYSVEIDYFAKMQNPDDEIIINPEDHSEYKWISEDEIDTYLPKDDPETEAVKKGFQMLNKS